MRKKGEMRRMGQKKISFQMETVEGDIHTPISIFQKMNGPKKFLLESSTSHHDQGRYSYMGMSPYKEAISREACIEIREGVQSREQDIRLVDYLKQEFMFEFEADTEIPFIGGAVGYMGYDMIRHYESIGAVPKDTLGMPDAHFLFFKDIFIFDHQQQKIHLVTSDEQSEDRLKEMKELLNRPQAADEKSVEQLSFTSNMTKAHFIKIVEEAKQAIINGDIFQVVLSQRYQSSFTGHPLGVYRRLRLSNPSPYMFYIDFGDYTILGSSPESLISVRGKSVTVNPIAGTRPRGETDEEDKSHAENLLHDEKELAEHRMLVDLGRNDLGRVCEIGSVALSSNMNIERYRHVMHLTSKVRGTLKTELTGLDALASCLPAGTVSGAPKIRAMELINELEDCKRGVYAGSVGYIGYGGDLDMALAIRTMVIKDDFAFVQAGAGIVYDSVPETEYEETKNKAKALLEVQTHDPINR